MTISLKYSIQGRMSAFYFMTILNDGRMQKPLREKKDLLFKIDFKKKVTKT